MEQEIIPITRRDFQSLEIMILKNSNKFCSHCDSELEEHILKDGRTVIYLCYGCDTIWEKKILDKNDFYLLRSEELTII